MRAVCPTSCVRVSAAEMQREFGEKGLRVTVDLSLCGTRSANYEKTAEKDPWLVHVYGTTREHCLFDMLDVA